MTSANALPEREPTLTIGQVSELTGLSADTLRYYEKAGLIERVGRNTGNQRRYAAADLDWLRFLLRLRETDLQQAAGVQDDKINYYGLLLTEQHGTDQT